MLSPQGIAVERYWSRIPDRFPGVQYDVYVIMPDHLHGIVFLGADSEDESTASVGDIVQWFKNSVHAEYRSQVASGAWEPYAGKLWQRKCWDRLIRNDRELEQIQQYILDNPARWYKKQTGG